jgi:hypothetical protein
MANDPIYALTNLKNKITDIARPYMFRMAVGSTGGTSKIAADAGLLSATLRSANLPGLQLQEVAVNYFGMTYKIAGTPNYEPLTCTIIVDTNYKSRQAWWNALKEIFTYTDDKGPEWKYPTEYLGEVYLYGMGVKYGDAVNYKLSMAWLSIMAPLAMSHDNKDAPLTFDATITYSFYTTDAQGIDFKGDTAK